MKLMKPKPPKTQGRCPRMSGNVRFSNSFACPSCRVFRRFEHRQRRRVAATLKSRQRYTSPMLRQFDRLLLRVESLPAAAKFWRETYGAIVSREDRQAVCIELPGGGEVILHNDANLPEQAV